ncbi:hypothetical protein DLAC_11503 [Tieghemostelium lacteum]|uniref:Uncharacterized protein n=1 Tax=Tieghemostelium lacteum TaxID=361077 RepID=A0A152A5L2_TIELA|nr:hypothetical protein DLAC_11503 [Tieghemostelium lacteum]|eukprot:KYR01367.1 hypothetical protein DLAC_11503 [Tieghemostelium lacteum]
MKLFINVFLFVILFVLCNCENLCPDPINDGVFHKWSVYLSTKGLETLGELRKIYYLHDSSDSVQIVNLDDLFYSAYLDRVLQNDNSQIYTYSDDADKNSNNAHHKSILSLETIIENGEEINRGFFIGHTFSKLHQYIEGGRMNGLNI